MAVINKNIAIREFSEEYQKLNESKKNNFARLCNKLLNENFIYGQKPDEKEDYYAILNFKKIMQDYFSIMDYELVLDDVYWIFYLKTTADRNRIRLKKLETIISLLLRLLYYQGNRNVNSSSNITTTVNNLLGEINKTGIYKTGISNSDFFFAIKNLKRYKLINFNFTELKDDSLIEIYPTILHVITIDDINMLKDKIDSYNYKGDGLDEINED